MQTIANSASQGQITLTFWLHFAHDKLTLAQIGGINAVQIKLKLLADRLRLITISLVTCLCAHSLMAEKLSIETPKPVAVKPASVDTIVLLNQGQIEGKLLTVDPDQTVYQIQLVSGGILSIEKDQVDRVIRQNHSLDEYHRISPTFADTAKKQWEISHWCSQHRLKDLAMLHAKRVVQLDPNHSKAHGLLGNSYRNGEWIPREVYLKSKGYVKYEGSWMSLERAALREIRTRTNERYLQWQFDLMQWRRGLDDRRVEKTNIKLIEVQNPDAVPGIIYLLGKEDNSELQDAYIKVLGNIGNSSAINFLIFNSVFQNNERLRNLCLKQVLRHQTPYFIQRYARYLDHYDNGIVNRAAYALGHLKYRSSVVPLANALVTRHINEDALDDPEKNPIYFPSRQPFGHRFDVKGPRPSKIHLTTDGFNAKSINPYGVVKIKNRGVRDSLVYISDGVDFGFETTAWKSWYISQLTIRVPTIRGRRDE
ncbi:MAG: hypothetical protein COA78_28990 [Blastopirellula sp.]|nr:MAG: hypothetical protein COA78_28990 [Blastopirellula sp.]